MRGAPAESRTGLSPRQHPAGLSPGVLAELPQIRRDAPVHGRLMPVYAFIDEDDHTINDGTFFCPDLVPRTWHDLPAVRHSLGANLSFADGHAEPKRWRWPNKPFPPTGLPVNPDDAQDLQWLWDHSPGPY
jgi:prepilin-type processing-associated H-X9-DG protein